MSRSRRTTILLVLHWLIAATLILAYLGLATAGTHIVGLPQASYFRDSEVIEHGWPCVFLARDTVEVLDSSRWAVWEGTKSWNVWGALVDALCFVIVTGGIIGYAVWKARKGRACGLSLRECLAITLFVAIVAAHFTACMRRSEEISRIADEIDAWNGAVGFRYGGPRWFARVHGDVVYADPFGIELYAVDSVALPREPSKASAAIETLASARRVRGVYITCDGWDEETTRQVLHAMRKWRPEFVDLRNVSIPDAAIAEVVAFPTLRELALVSDGIGDQHVALLRNCRTLELLDVTCTDISAAGIRDLLTLPHLREIYVDRELLKQHPELKQFATEHGKKLEVYEFSIPVVG